MRRALAALLGAATLAACTSAQVNTALGDAVKPPDQRCAEARAIADELAVTDPAQETRWRMLALAACV